MAKKNINKLNRKEAGGSLAAGLRSLQRILSQPGSTVVRELVAAASDAFGGTCAKDPDWGWVASCTAFVIRRGNWIEEQIRLGRKVTDKDRRIAGLHSLLCVRCQEVKNSATSTGKVVNASIAKLAETKTSVPPAERVKIVRPVTSSPRMRGEKHLGWARESFMEDGNLKKPIELIDQAAEALKVAS